MPSGRRPGRTLRVSVASAILDRLEVLHDGADSCRGDLVCRGVAGRREGIAPDRHRRAVQGEQLAPIVRLADGGIAPNWPAAFVVYVLLGTGIALFVIPRAATMAQAAGYGALYGLVVYGVYDFTNYSTLRQWPFVLTLADVAWGTFATAACAAVVRLVVR